VRMVFRENIPICITNLINVVTIATSQPLYIKQTHHMQTATGKVDHTMVESASSPE
jgi:hypothetical protein